MGDGEQAEVNAIAVDKVVGKSNFKATTRIDWRKLFIPLLFVMVLPTVSALILDKSLGTLPLITIASIVICFPLATFFVIRIALQEMDRVIAEVAPPLPELTPETAIIEEQVVTQEDVAREVVEQEVAAPDTALASTPDADAESVPRPE